MNVGAGYMERLRGLPLRYLSLQTIGAIMDARV